MYPDNTLIIVEYGEIIPAIQCTAHCNPDCITTWRKAGYEFVLSNDGILTLGTAMEHTSGEYVCTATRNRTFKKSSKSLIVLLKDDKGI